MHIQPYLNFDGDCAEAFRLYERVLGGTLELLTHADSPMAASIPAEWSGRILHARLEAGDAVLLGSDVPAGAYEPPRSMLVSVAVTDVDEADRIFRELSEGGRVTMPIAETFWSPRFGMFVDRFGIPWMVNTVPAEKAVG